MHEQEKRQEVLPQLMSVSQAADVLGVSQRHVARLCERGKIKAVKIGRLWRVNRDALAVQCSIKL